MRCPICGTENAPDSRFCGGCGKAMPPPGKLAPTAKIPDDAPLAPPTRPVQRVSPLAGHVSYAPPAMPTPPPGSLQSPGYQSPGSIAPTVQRVPVRAPVAPAPSRALASNPSMSFASAPGRPLGLIALVLIIDLGLAASGAFLLAKGLAKPEAKPASTTKAEQKSEARPSPAPTVTPIVTPIEPTETAAAAPAAEVPAPAAKVAPPKPDPKSSAARRTDDRKPDKQSGPVTSPSSSTTPAKPAVVSTEAELDKQAAASRGAFKRCHEEAGDVRGTIAIAFQVMADGRVADAAPVENTTNNGTLAYCLVTTIGAWKLSPHNGAPLAFVRPFSYP